MHYISENAGFNKYNSLNIRDIVVVIISSIGVSCIF